MPELPEVETVRCGLAPTMEGALIEKVEQRRANLRFPFPDNFAQRLEGRTIIELGRRAKYLLCHLDNGQSLISHLGMSGSFRVAEISDTHSNDDQPHYTPGNLHFEQAKLEKHDHVVIHLKHVGHLKHDRHPKHESASSRVIYNDPRRFGFMDLAQRNDLETHAFFKDLGVEPTGNALSVDYLAEKFHGKKTPLKSALLDQRIIAGLGNIYVCEALWRAGYSPQRPAGSIAGCPTGLLRLANSIYDVIQEAIQAGGSTLRDHIKADGSLGYFQHSFSVYGREGNDCANPDCSGEVTRITQSGRSSFFCPQCQN